MKNDKGELVDIGLGVYATKPLNKGTELPVWGSIGFKSEFSEHQMITCDRKVGVKFDMSSGNESDYVMLIHRGCVSGYINDCSEPYDNTQKNCILTNKFPYFDHSRAEYYVSVTITKRIEVGDQLLFSYGKDYWQWETDHVVDFNRNVRRKKV